ncbi:hypothetical protein DN051_39780 [Streptomyces cadmiisoli]|uniref:Uncharacterized protein n=1 Tax=Streptomyces cadmiisoli TaxID=2184053 RepID=A0A2Z4JBA0_9ACTN|nr:hypothetical protein DN051_39780 [Streptomyces cadmiisoli]
MEAEVAEGEAEEEAEAEVEVTPTSAPAHVKAAAAPRATLLGFRMCSLFMEGQASFACHDRTAPAGEA